MADSTFSGSTSCLINTVAQPCTLVTNSQFTVIKIASSSSFNLYPMSPTTTSVQINQLKFLYSSSHSTYLYHFYFQLTVSLASGATVKKFLGVPMVVKERNLLTNFNIYFSNNIYNSGPILSTSLDWSALILRSGKTSFRSTKKRGVDFYLCLARLEKFVYQSD